MAGRFPGGVPNFEGVWTFLKGRQLTEFLNRLTQGMIGLQGTAETPTEVQAGVDAAGGGSQAPADALHVHSIETAAPSLEVALGGASDEGSGSALMRADAQLVLASGGATDGQVLVWNAGLGEWVPQDLETEDVLTWMDL